IKRRKNYWFIHLLRSPCSPFIPYLIFCCEEYTRPLDLSCPTNGIFPGSFSPCMCTFPLWVYPLEGRANDLFRANQGECRFQSAEERALLLAHVSLLLQAMRLRQYQVHPGWRKDQLDTLQVDYHVLYERIFSLI